MRLKEEHIERISHLILRDLKAKNLIEPRVSEKKIEDKIIEVITKDMQMEAKIDTEARTMMDQYRSQIDAGEMDERKMFSMIKKELIKKNKFIL